MARKTQGGIACPGCACRHNTVTKTIQSDGQLNGRKVTITRRRRLCKHCGKGYWTIECLDPEEGSNTVMDKPLNPTFTKESRGKQSPENEEDNPYL